MSEIADRWMHRLKKIRPFYSTNTFGLESATDLAKNGERFMGGHQKQGDLSVTFGRSAGQEACYCLQRESNMNQRKEWFFSCGSKTASNWTTPPDPPSKLTVFLGSVPRRSEWEHVRRTRGKWQRKRQLRLKTPPEHNDDLLKSFAFLNKNNSWKDCMHCPLFMFLCLRKVCFTG